MNAYRIYHIEDDRKIYLCNRPGYWLHLSADPEYAIPFIEEQKAADAATLAANHMNPLGRRYVEEYVENRKLIRFILSGQVILAEMISYFANSNAKYELIS